jgi:ketosteroid isomerase-like protein
MEGVMKLRAWSVVVVGVSCVLAAACQQAVPLSDQDKAAIQKAYDEYASAVVNEKTDFATLAKTFYTDTARVLPANMPAVEGQAAIAQLYTAMGHPKTFKFGPLTIEGGGGGAHVEATWEGTFVPPGGGDPIADKGKSLAVLQKQADGSWKLSRDMWNSDQPPPGLVVLGGALKADASAELKALDSFAGKWAMTGEAKAPSMFGPAGKSTLTMDCRWQAGGTNLFCTVDGTLPGGPYHDVMIHTYDAAAKAYRGFDADNTGMASPFGLSISKDAWTYTYDMKMDGKPVKVRSTIFNLSKDGYSFKQEVSVAGGPFTVIVEGAGRKLPG